MNNIPTISQIASRLKSSIETQYSNNIPTTGKSFLRGLINTLAGEFKTVWLGIAFVQRNIWPDTADPESKGGTLERAGRIKLGRNPFQPVAGQYEITITGSISAVIPASTQFKSNDDAFHPGIIYILDQSYTLIATTDTIIVRALTAGLEGKLNNGDKVTSTAPIALVNSEGTVSAEPVQPLAGETEAEYRRKVLLSYRLEATGGSDADWKIWSIDAQGVKDVYPYAKSAASSEINLFIEANPADSQDGFGTPTQSIIDEVDAVINFNPDITLTIRERGRRPTQVIPNLFPVTPLSIDIIITGAINFSPAEKIAIQAAIEETIFKIRPFCAGADILSERNDIIDNNQIIGTIITVKPGAQFTGITIKVNNVILATYNFTGGDIPYFSTITYV